MNSFQGKFARAATVATLALSTVVSTVMPATSMAGETAAQPVQNAQQQRQIINEYSGPDTAEGLQAEINRLSNGTALFVMFYANWCNHCKNMTQVLNDAQGKTPLVYRVLRVPVSVAQGRDEQGRPIMASPYPVLAEKFGVEGFPATDVYVNGRQVKERIDGGRPIGAVIAYMNNLHNELLASAQKKRAPAP